MLLNNLHIFQITISENLKLNLRSQTSKPKRNNHNFIYYMLYALKHSVLKYCANSKLYTSNPKNKIFSRPDI